MNELIHISYAKIYRFEHIAFEWSDYLGPVFLRIKDLKPKNNQWRTNRDYAALSRFLNLTDKEKVLFKVV